MHILVIPSIFSTPTEPMRGITFWEQAVTLQARGNRVGIIAIPSRVRTWHGLQEIAGFWRHSASGMLVEATQPIPIYRIAWWGWRGTVSLQRRTELALLAFETYCRDYGRPDVIYARGILYGGYLAAKIKAVTGTPVVIMEEFSAPYLRGILFFDQRNTIKHALRLSDRLITMSVPLAKALRQFAGEKSIEVLPNSVNTDFFIPAPQPLAARPFRFAFIARLDANKAAMLVLKAFGDIFRGQDVELSIAGEGPERRNLERLAEQSGITNQVRFLGLQSREQVRHLLQSSHVLVSSSYVETFGNTLIEAMACGKPVISTLSGGPDEIINERVGMVVPRGDLVAMRHALQTMIERYSDYDLDAIRGECISRFGEAEILGRLETIYRDVAQLAT